MGFHLFMQELSDLKKTLNVEVDQLRLVSVLLNFFCQISFVVLNFVYEIKIRNFKI